MLPSKANCSKCVAREECPISQANTSSNKKENAHKPAFDVFRSILESVQKKLKSPTLLNSIQTLGACFKEEKALDQDALMDALMVIDMRLGVIEERLNEDDSPVTLAYADIKDLVSSMREVTTVSFAEEKKLKEKQAILDLGREIRAEEKKH